MKGQLELPIPLATLSCARCGATYELATRARGRPVAFCGEACREAEAADQQRTWAASNPAGFDRRTGRQCATCGKTFDAMRRPGRLPVFCSPACKAKGRPR